ncbi:MAG: VWA domain-containing protein [Candidatus Tectomicrobia bacterium]|uniref:VWA domain-containing protein n=1 Tax=Tectimicrobiota bacterium TaxID=2528274 RepID=A0A932CLQ2_UNCTE|nr:VWA domain-containing protein [Candidatus Tectomicrobia bacterium]
MTDDGYCGVKGGKREKGLRAIAEALEKVHEKLGAEFRRALPGMVDRLSPEEILTWGSLGREWAASHWQGRELAAEYFRASPQVVGYLPSPLGQRLREWMDHGRSLAQLSSEAGREYLRASPAFLQQAGFPCLRAWAEEGVRLFRSAGKPTRLLSLYLVSSPEILSLGGWELLRLWGEVGGQLTKLDLQWALSLFAEGPALLAQFTPPFREKALTLGGLLAPTMRKQTSIPAGNWMKGPHDPGQAPIGGPRAGAKSDPGLSGRSGVLALWQFCARAMGRIEESDWEPFWEMALRIARHAPEKALPFWEDAPAHHLLLGKAERDRLISVGLRLAPLSGEAVAELFGHLPRILEVVPRVALAGWMEEGVALARENPSAAVAFFRLESRRSRRALDDRDGGVPLTEVASLLKLYAHALTGKKIEIQPWEAEDPAHYPLPEGQDFRLPPEVKRYPTRRENFAVYRIYTAHQAGYLEFGSLELPLVGFLAPFPQPDLARQLFHRLEDARVDWRLRHAYRGLAQELERFLTQPAPPGEPALLEEINRLLLPLCLDRPPAPSPGPIAAAMQRILSRLFRPAATVYTTAWVTAGLYLLLQPTFDLPAVLRDEAWVPDELLEGLLQEALTHLDAPSAPGNQEAPPEELLEKLDFKTALDGREGEGTPISWELLLQLIEAGIQLELKGLSQGEIDASGLCIADLDLPSLPAQESSAEKGETDKLPVARKKAAPSTRMERFFFYDEWDYLIQDYRLGWCRLREMAPEGSSIDFVDQALEEYADLILALRKRFQRLKPQAYHKQRRAIEGEEIELDAALEAVVDRKSGQSPSEKVYIERRRKRREVSTLFLLDMSASTDEKLPDSPKRIIDVEKEAALLMAEALDALGDEYAIYGFSGFGRENVDFFIVKDFGEGYSLEVKTRLAALRPHRSTRMGPAIRHSLQKLVARESQLKTLILLSDGYPQDHDYGEDRTDREYGLHDTRMALQEVRRLGIKAFCVTVDPSGNDYLRQMCGGPHYLVIRDVASLPRELPRIYQGLTF